MLVTRAIPAIRWATLRMLHNGSFRSQHPNRMLMRNNTSVAGGTTLDEATKPTTPESVLLYEKKSKTLLRISSTASVISGFYWVAYVATVEGQLQTAGYAPEPWGYLGMAMTGVMIFASNTFANKLVSKVSYLPASNALAICTHSFSGRRREPRMVEVGNTILPETRRKSAYMPFKVKGDRAFTLLDRDDGVFYNRDLLMSLLGGSVGDGALRKDASGRIAEVDSEDVHPYNPKAGKRGKAKSR